MEQYSTPVLVPQRQTHMGCPHMGCTEGIWEAPALAEEPSCSELLAAIQGSHVVLEGKIKAVAVEVNLLRTDLRKVSDKVKVVEGSIVDLQAEISIYPDNTNKCVLEVKAQLRAINIRYMLLYLARLKVLSGGKSHFFEHPEEVWRWLEVWEKSGTGRSVRPTRGAARASGVDDTDWRKRGESLTQISAQGPAGSGGRVEIQQDGTMAVVVHELTDEY
ncbi:hypothetical protein NDU88_007479 [Pleurodeles waltl]|uniref:Uncharacterized protein n=1 Tax=Pleurodeles waltl TaxID=8319 RepID=A0AAV7N4E2_PLEWA|nr:hypothetical protein NDU88_007479 [Pleurodeles waltl]